MPLYEYECTACGHRFERIQKFADAPLDSCPVCGGALQKLVSSPAFQFKGSGWYVTDYARKSGAKTTDGASGDAKDKPSTDSNDASKDSKESTSKDAPKESTSTISKETSTPKT
jgi:putative FmdB family regulatory protein